MAWTHLGNDEVFFAAVLLYWSQVLLVFTCTDLWSFTPWACQNDFNWSLFEKGSKHWFSKFERHLYLFIYYRRDRGIFFFFFFFSLPVHEKKRVPLLFSCYSSKKARKNIWMFPCTIILPNTNYAHFSDNSLVAHVPASLTIGHHYIKLPVSLPATLLCFIEAQTVVQERASTAKNQHEQEHPVGAIDLPPHLLGFWLLSTFGRKCSLKADILPFPCPRIILMDPLLRSGYCSTYQNNSIFKVLQSQMHRKSAMSFHCLLWVTTASC